MTDNRFKFIKENWIYIISCIICVAGWGLFLFWMSSTKKNDVLAHIPSLIIFFLFCGSFLKIVPHKTNLLNSWIVKLLIWCIFMYTFIAVLSWGNHSWWSTDDQSYYDIASGWYSSVGDAQYRIVFFPLYPIILKFVKLFFKEYFHAASLLNAILAFLSGIMFHKLSEKVIPEENRKRALKYLFILPASFFFFMTTTESLFLLISISFFVFLLDKNWILVFVCGFLASLTRMHGVLLLVPFVIECFVLFKQSIFNKEKKIKDFLWILSAAGAPLGLLVYFLINYKYYGNPLEFLSYQKNHWSNSLSFFWNTPMYLIEYFNRYLSGKDWRSLLGLSIPNITTIFGFILLVFYGGKKLRPSFAAYSLVYFVISFGQTWLISAPRYASVCFPLAFFAAVSIPKKFDKFFTAICIIVFVLYLHAFVARFPVY